MKNLVDLAEQDVLDFLRTNQELLFNERDFQMHLATHLRQTKHYDDVDVEYYVPCDALENYIWNSELRLDILVQKNDEYLPIELKYKTKRAEKKRFAIWRKHRENTSPEESRSTRFRYVRFLERCSSHRTRS